MPSQSFGEGFGVFLENGRTHLAGDFLEAFVVAGLDAGVVEGGIHDVGFHENDRAFVQPVCEEISRPEIRMVGNRSDVWGVGKIGERRELADFRKRIGHGRADESFFFVSPLEEFIKQREPLIGEADFFVIISAVEQKVEMGAVDERRIVRVAPSFSVEMQTKDEIGFNRFVDEFGAGADFGGAVKKAFGETEPGGGRIIGRAEIFRSIQQRIWADRCDRFGRFADERDFCAERFEFRPEKFRDEKCHVALGDRFSVADDEPAFLHFRPVSADVARVDGDVEAFERPVGWGGREFRSRPPVARGGGGETGWGEFQVEDVGWFRLTRLDAGFGVVDFDQRAPGVTGRENGREQIFEIRASDGVLKFGQQIPVGRLGEGGEAGFFRWIGNRLRRDGRNRFEVENSGGDRGDQNDGEERQGSAHAFRSGGSSNFSLFLGKRRRFLSAD